MRLKNIKPLNEEYPLFGKSYEQSAHDWIDSHQDVIGLISHYIDDGDEKAAEQYLQYKITNDKLFTAVMNVLFRGYAFHKHT